MLHLGHPSVKLAFFFLELQVCGSKKIECLLEEFGTTILIHTRVKKNGFTHHCFLHYQYKYIKEAKKTHNVLVQL